MKALNGVRGNKKKWLAKGTKHETWRMFCKNLQSRADHKDKISSQSILEFYKFAFVRNPWDRMASFYRYLRESRPRQEIDTVSSFKDFLIQAESGVKWIERLHGMKQQTRYFAGDEGALELDFLGHYEYLHDDFNQITKILKIPAALPHLNMSSNTRSNYVDDYDDEMVGIVERRFADDIRVFGYEFGKKEPNVRFSGPIMLGM